MERERKEIDEEKCGKRKEIDKEKFKSQSTSSSNTQVIISIVFSFSFSSFMLKNSCVWLVRKGKCN